MILETAFITVVPGSEQDFLDALPAGIEVLKQAQGFVDIEICKGVERSNVFLLKLRWQTLENHTIDFREGPLFAQWRAVISPFFESAPAVEHWEFV